MENKFYRPLITAVCSVCKFICRVLEGLTDGLVVLLRKTIYRDKPLPHELAEGNEFTYAVGGFMDSTVKVLNKTVYKGNPKENKNYRHKLAMYYAMIHENNKIITRSLSFGLMMFCTGLFIVLVYLLTV